MLRPPRKRRQAWELRRIPAVLVASLAATAFFGYHAVYGAHGLHAHRRTLDRLDLLGREIAVLEATQRRLKHDVALLSRDTMPPDMVEEAARSTLGYSRPGDLIVLDRR